MPDKALSEFVEKVSEIMPIIMREFFKQQTSGFHKMKVTLPQFAVLDILARHGELKMSDLAHFLNVTTAAMTGIVERLVRDGYLKRIREARDRRVVKVVMTPRGARMITAIIDERKRMVARMFEMISEDERKEYLKILGHIREHLKNREGKVK